MRNRRNSGSMVAPDELVSQIEIWSREPREADRHDSDGTAYLQGLGMIRSTSPQRPSNRYPMGGCKN
jgi:hypothetical protein